MALIKYTAKRKLMAGHDAGKSYQFEVPLEDWSPQIDTPGNSAESLSGRTFETLYAIKESWQGRTIALEDSTTIAQMREFLFSVAAGETFTIDPYGSISSPDNPVLCFLKGQQKFQDDLVGTTGAHAFSFTAHQQSFVPSVSSNIILSGQFSRSTVAWGWDGSAVLQEFAVDEIVREYDPGTGVYLGLRAEEGRVNQLLDSRALGSSEWSEFPGGGISLSQNQTGLDGASNTAFTLEDVTTGDRASQFQDRSVSDDNAWHVATYFIKKEDDDSVIPGCGLRLVDGTAVSLVINIRKSDGQTAVAAQSGTGEHRVFDAGAWWRLEIAVQNNSSGNTTLKWENSPAQEDGPSLDGVIENTHTGANVIDFPQVETNSRYSTSPIKTQGSPFTRAEDVIEAAPVKATTIVLEGTYTTEAGDGPIWLQDTGNANEVLQVKVVNGNLVYTLHSNGTLVESLNAGPINQDGTYRVAFTVDQDMAISHNGGAVKETSGVTLSSYAAMRFARFTNGPTHGRQWFSVAEDYGGVVTKELLQRLSST